MLVPSSKTMLDCFFQETGKYARNHQRARLFAEEELIEKFLPNEDPLKSNDIYSNNVVFMIVHEMFNRFMIDYTFAEGNEKEIVKSRCLDMDSVVRGLRTELEKAEQQQHLAQTIDQHIIQILFIVYALLSIDLEHPELSMFHDQIRGNFRSYIRENDPNAIETLVLLNKCVISLRKQSFDDVSFDEDLPSDLPSTSPVENSETKKDVTTSPIDQGREAIKKAIEDYLSKKQA